MKGISFIEQHVEKIVVGVAAAMLLGAIALEVMSSRSLQAGSETISPSNVNEVLDNRAKGVETKLNDGRVHADLPDAVPAISADFEKALAAGVSGGKPLPRIAPSLAGSLLDSDSRSDTWYRKPQVPMLSMIPEVLQTSDAITAETLAGPDAKGLAAILPPHASAAAVDLTWTTPAAWFDVRAMLDDLKKSEPNGKPHPLAAAPGAWYQEGCFVVDVVFEREELLPTGAWGNRQIVSPLPDRLTFRPKVAAAELARANSTTANPAPPNLDLRNEIFATLSKASKQFEILQPEFYPTKNEVFFSEEKLTAANAPKAGESREIQRLRQRVADRKKQLANREQALKDAGGPLEDEPPKPKGGNKPGGGGTGGGGGKDGGSGGAGGGGKDGGEGGGRRGGGGGVPPGGGGGPGGGMGGGGAMGPGSPPTNPGSSNDAARDALRRRLTKLVKQLREELTKFQSELNQLAPETKQEAENEAEDRKIPELTSKDRVLVWAHDLGVKPQVSYRYRSIASVYNPFYGRERQLVADQAKTLAQGIVLASEASGWSQPVQVTPSSTFFVTGANLDGGGTGGIKMGTAEVEVYRLVEGVRKKERFTVQPGDRIGRLVEPRKNDSAPAIDYTTDWFVVAIVEDATADRAESERNKSCIVVVRRIDGTEDLLLRSPAADSASNDRRRLLDEEAAAPTVAVPPAKGSSGSG